MSFIIFLNNAQIYWMFKKQNTCKRSTFGSELVAMKTAMEYISGLRYNLRMTGITLSEPVYVYGDNMSIIHSPPPPRTNVQEETQFNILSFH